MTPTGNLAYEMPTSVGMEYIQTLLRPSLPDIDESVGSLAQLMLVEEVLDELASRSQSSTMQYQYLVCKAKAFIQANPELLTHKWFRNGGAIYDLIHEIREQNLIAME